MAYSILGTLPAVNGLYTAFFPVLIYAFLGTSKHISIGKSKPPYDIPNYCWYR